jgi:hypothetical protein
MISSRPYTGMAVGDAHDLEQALDRAVLAVAAVQGIVDHVRAQLGEPGRQIAADIDRADPIAALAQRRDRRLAAHQRNLALGRPAAQEHRDMLHAATSR